MSDLHFICPHCHGTLVIDAEGAGWEVACPLCASPVVIPDEDQREEGVEYVETASQDYYVGGGVEPAVEMTAPEAVVETEEPGEVLQYVDPETGYTYEVSADQIPPGYELYLGEDGVPFLQEVGDAGVVPVEVAGYEAPVVERRISLPSRREEGAKPYRGTRRGASKGSRGRSGGGDDSNDGTGALRAEWELYRCGDCTGVFRLRRGNRGAVVQCPECDLPVDTAKNGGGGSGDRAVGVDRRGVVPGGDGVGAAERRRRRRDGAGAGAGAGTVAGGRAAGVPRRGVGEGERERIPFQKKAVDESAFQFKKPEDVVPAKRVRKKAGDGTLAKAEEEYRQKKELPWERQDTGVAVEKGGRKGVAIFSGLALLLLGAGVGWMWYSSQRPDAGQSGWMVEAVGGGAGEGGGDLQAAGRMLSMDRQEEFYAFVNDTRSEALGVLKAFLEAPTHEERLKYVANPDRVRQLSERASRYRSDEAFPYRKIDDSAVSVVRGRPSIIVNVDLHDYTTKRVALHYLPEGYRVDWEWFVEYNDTSWVDFTSRKPSDAMTFRVQAERDNYFNFGFVDGARWDCYKLVSGDGEYQIYGYVDKASPAGERMREAFVKEPAGVGRGAVMYPRIRCVLKLRYPDAGGQANQVEVVDFVRDDWYGLVERGG
ncbi:MAG: hypothetical protein AAF591_06765 [Verrucomicrobiota bacterium]